MEQSRHLDPGRQALPSQALRLTPRVSVTPVYTLSTYFTCSAELLPRLCTAVHPHSLSPPFRTPCSRTYCPSNSTRGQCSEPPTPAPSCKPCSSTPMAARAKSWAEEGTGWIHGYLLFDVSTHSPSLLTSNCREYVPLTGVDTAVLAEHSGPTPTTRSPRQPDRSCAITLPTRRATTRASRRSISTRRSARGSGSCPVSPTPPAICRVSFRL
eukprot:COSAG01_NODE_11971_length_1824_cov_15.826667_3_plen_212_part_00